jgi:hypothetical protein
VATVAFTPHPVPGVKERSGANQKKTYTKWESTMTKIIRINLLVVVHQRPVELLGQRGCTIAQRE